MADTAELVSRIGDRGGNPPFRRVRIGSLWVDSVTFGGALDRIEALVAGRDGGAVYTPNVDHVVAAERTPEFAAAYSRASLAVPDGQMLVWASRLLGQPLPERVSGSDLLMPLMERAAALDWRVYLLGGGPGVAEEAMAAVRRRYPVDFVGRDAREVPPGPNRNGDGAIIRRIRVARPDLVIVALGAPKQELLIDRIIGEIHPAVAIGVGAAIDFAAGRASRAPGWVSDAGLEWLYRLCREPRRLWRRYLVDDPAFVSILLRTRRQALQAPALTVVPPAQETEAA